MESKNLPSSDGNSIVPTTWAGTVTVENVAAIPEESIWLASRKSARTRRAYKNDVRLFMQFFHITTPDELRQISHKQIMLWERQMREVEGLEHTTVRRRLSALSSLFTHLVKFGVANNNPVKEVERPAVNRREGMTLAFSQEQARAILDGPDPSSLLGLRDRAILSVGLQVGFRRAEIAHLTVDALHQNRGYDSLRVVRKGGKKDALAINQTTAQRIREYLEAAGHGDDGDGPMFRPVRSNRRGHELRRHLDPDVIDRILRKYARMVGLERGYSAHSMRATFITTELDNGSSLEDVQRASGHADPATTKLYDRRGYNPEKSASFFANY